MVRNCFIDIHCHLEACEDIDGSVQRARKANVKLILTCGVNKETNRDALKMCEEYPEVKACAGFYPIDALKASDKEIDEEIEFIRKNKDRIAAIGEVGIDFKEDAENHERQKKIFRKFADLSIELDKPIIVHSRKAELECIEILEEKKAEKVIMHCFCGSKKLEERIIKNKWSLTVPTSVTRSQQFQERAKSAPLKQLFCETDSPFLHPDKVGRNEPANVAVSYQFIANAKNMKKEHVIEEIFNNFNRLFE